MNTRFFQSHTLILTIVLSATFGLPAKVFADSFQTADVYSFVTRDAVGGGATLLRRTCEPGPEFGHCKESAEFRVALAGLEPNFTYSVWVLFWNNAFACDPDTNADFGLCLPSFDSPDGVWSLAGFVTGDDGTVNFSAEIDVGPLPDGLPVRGELTDTRDSEFHLVISDHGPTLAGTVDDEMSSPAAGDFFVVFPPAGL